MQVPIARKTRVQNIRDAWKQEPEFSDWLITEDGIRFICDELEIEIDGMRRESRGSNFPCDIVGHLLGEEDHIVVIENQFGKTDHDHLGKLLTYAAVHRATTGIWICERAADDHRQVIDWLNENTPSTVNLYLVEIHLHRIADSPVAPSFNVVSRPNALLKESRRSISEADRTRLDWRLQMWTDIKEHIEATRPPFRIQKPSTDHWSSIAIGRTGFSIAMLLTPRHGSIGVELSFNVPWKDFAFQELLAQKEQIEAEVGETLEWMPLPDKLSARILLKTQINPKDPANRERVLDWFALTTRKMHAAFRERVRLLEPPVHTEPEPDLIFDGPG